MPMEEGIVTWCGTVLPLSADCGFLRSGGAVVPRPTLPSGCIAWTQAVIEGVVVVVSGLTGPCSQHTEVPYVEQQAFNILSR